MSWLRKFGKVLAKTFETTVTVVETVDKKVLDPVCGEEVEKKLFGDMLENHCQRAVDDFNAGREEAKNERKAKDSQRDSQEGCSGRDSCTCGDCDPGWVEVR